MTSAPSADAVGPIVQSLLLYSVAEAQAGHATVIRVRVDGRSFSVSDNGRGHAIDRRVGGLPYLRLIYDQFEFPFGLADGPAVQLQGIASSLIRGMCCDFTVTVRRDGTTHRLRWPDGSPSTTTAASAADEERGTAIEGTVRPEWPCAPDIAALAGWLARVQAAVPGLRIVFDGHPIADAGPRSAA